MASASRKDLSCMNSRLKLSAVVGTKNGAARLPALIEKLREIADEVVILVDSTTSDGSADVAARAGARVATFVHDQYFSEMRRQMLAQCRGDWLLNLDDDESLNSRATRSVLEAMMSKRAVTHYWFSDRELVPPGDKYIRNGPWVPNWHLRMFRNIPSIIVEPQLFHEGWRIAGEPEYLADLHIYHWNYVWNDRATREAKVAAYGATNPENLSLTEKHTLYEDYYFETEPVKGEDDLPPETVYAQRPVRDERIDLDVTDFFSEITVGQSYLARVSIANGSSRTLLPQSEFLRWGTLELATRWFANAESRESLGEPALTPFPARIAPDTAMPALANVHAPSAPGEYWLQADIREEAAWFSEATSAGEHQRVRVQVVPLVWPPSRRRAR